MEVKVRVLAKGKQPVFSPIKRGKIKIQRNNSKIGWFYILCVKLIDKMQIVIKLQIKFHFKLKKIKILFLVNLKNYLNDQKGQFKNKKNLSRKN